jgi:hypothetical protein
MSRNLGRKTLFRALLATTTAACAPAALPVAMGTCAAVLAGCSGDEQSPSTHVDRLQDPRRKEQAVKRLIQFYEDAMTKDQKNRDGENVKPLLEEIVPPLVELAQKNEISTAAQGDLLRFLADTRDPQVVPALVKALKDYRIDDKRAEPYDAAMTDVIRNIGEMVRAGKIKDNKEVNDVIFEVFTKAHNSYPKVQENFFNQILSGTLTEIADPSWEDRLIKMIQEPIKSAQPKQRKAASDQFYWQITATGILGKLESKKATEPLLKSILSPLKSPMHNEAMIALIRIGKPALDASLKLLEGGDEALANYAKEEYVRAIKDDQQAGFDENDPKAKAEVDKKAEKAWKDQTVQVVANVGTVGAIDPLIAKLDASDKDLKATIASSLYLLPKEQKSIDKFIEVYNATGVADKLPDGSYAIEALLEAAGNWMDEGLMGHVLATSHGLKGEKADVQGVQVTILDLGARAATEEQWEHIEKLKGVFPESKPKGDKYVFKDAKTNKEEKLTDKEIIEKLDKLEITTGLVREDKEGSTFTPIGEVGAFATAVQKANYMRGVNQAKIALDKCKKDVACYLKLMNGPEAAQAETAMQAVKAAYMVGLLGDDSIKMKLAEMVPTIKNGTVSSIVSLIFLNRSPKGDAALQKKLQELYDKANESRDKERIAMMSPFKIIIYRLEARQGK